MSAPQSETLRRLAGGTRFECRSKTNPVRCAYDEHGHDAVLDDRQEN